MKCASYYAIMTPMKMLKRGLRKMQECNVSKLLKLFSMLNENEIEILYDVIMDAGNQIKQESPLDVPAVIS